MATALDTFDHILVFDDGWSLLSPVNDLRLFSDCRTGMMTAFQRIQSLTTTPCHYFHPLHIQANLYPSVDIDLIKDEDSVLIINSRIADYDWILSEAEISDDDIRDEEGILVRAVCSGQDIHSIDFVDGMIPLDVAPHPCPFSLYSWPWDMIKYMDQMLAFDEQLLASQSDGEISTELPDAVSFIGDPGDLYLEADVKIGPMVVLDTSNGPIVIQEGVSIGAMAVINGPCHLGAHTQIAAQTRLRGKVFTGPWCKLAGEVSCSIIQGYSNKGHDGYLGHSYLGEWVNLGAMTTTSNLKNTYGHVKMQVDDLMDTQDTELQFLGSILGDHVKTAIGTRLMTGTCVGLGSMIACSGFPPKYLSKYRFLTDAGESSYDLDRFLEVAEKVMVRRQISMTDSYRELLTLMHGYSDGAETWV